MYDNLIMGGEAEQLYRQGATIEVVQRGVCRDVTNSDHHLFKSDLFIFRVKPEKRNEMLSEIQANRVTLDNCPRHRFDLKKSPFKIGEKVRCDRCSGWMSLTQVGYYVRGYAAAGANPCDIVDDWYGELISDDAQWHNKQPVTCPRCKGAGKLGEVPDQTVAAVNECHTCKGSGCVPRCNAILMTKGNLDIEY